jgi:predicted nucleotidyltransferase
MRSYVALKNIFNKRTDNTLNVLIRIARDKKLRLELQVVKKVMTTPYGKKASAILKRLFRYVSYICMI